MHWMKKISPLALIFFVYGCIGGANPLTSEESIEINFPLNKKSVYATSIIVETADSVYLDGLQIFSLVFLNRMQSNDEIEYNGSVESFNVREVSGIYRSFFPTLVSGDIHVTIKRNWVLFQHSSVDEAYNMFLKSVTDTMDLPTRYQHQFPSFPRTLSPSTSYAAFRPENSGDGWGYAGVYREFRTGSFRSWSTEWSQYSGLEMSGLHQLLGFQIGLDMIIDERGIVVSQLNFGENILTDEQGNLIGLANTYRISQRLVDYSNPEIIQPLPFYAEQMLTELPVIVDFEPVRKYTSR